MSTKVLLFDIETAPSLGWVWEKWETNVIDFEEDWYMLCFAAKWLGGKMSTYALPDYRGYKKNSENDKLLVKELWRLFDEADVLIAHNGDNFDVRKANARFAYYKLPPPSPYKTIDTWKVAKRHFNFISNKLNDLGTYLGYGEKISTSFGLWQGCMNGDKKSWAQMIKYNKRDVELLEKIYLHFRPWITNHTNLGSREESAVCPKCGSPKLQSRGYAINISTRYQRFQCQNCGGWSRGTKNMQVFKPLVNI